MRLGADKVKYVINFGIEPVFKNKNTLTESRTKFEFYVVIFNESWDDNTQNCKMDLLIRNVLMLMTK